MENGNDDLERQNFDSRTRTSNTKDIMLLLLTFETPDKALQKLYIQLCLLYVRGKREGDREEENFKLIQMAKQTLI